MLETTRSEPAISTRDLVVPTLERLLRHSKITGEDERSFWELFQLLTSESLNFRSDGTQSPFSGICNDGTPWQYCCQLGAQRSSLRYLTEIGRPGTTLRDRIALSRERIAAAFQMLQFPPAALQRAGALYGLLPDREELRAGLWVAVAYVDSGRCRVRVYANNGWGDELERWLRLVRCLEALGGIGYAASIRPLLPLLTEAFSPAGFAVTFPEEPPVCKLYLRPIRNSWSECRKILHFTAAKRGVEFIARVEEGLGCELESVPNRALILSLATSLSGGPFDTKIDLCGHCLFASDIEAEKTVSRMANRFGLNQGPYRTLLDAIGFSGWQSAPQLHSFLGVGMASDGTVRVNIYAKPILPEALQSSQRLFSGSMPRESIRSALQRGVDVLLRSLDPTGWWIDYALPVGPSTTWVTAYVANALLDACDFHETSGVREACMTAAKKIQEGFRPDEGWGYHEEIETDSDTTALCILLLRRMGLDTEAGRATLFTFARRDGGFGTFRRNNSDDAWGHTHADVFANVLRAIGGIPTTSNIDLLLGMRKARGLWHSYWWHTDLYATALSLGFLRDSGLSLECEASRDWLIDEAPLSNTFEHALCVRALSTLRSHTLVDSMRARLVLSLLESQLEDGSWAGAAALRVTRADCVRPWESSATSGRLYVDRGILTTATVVSALALVLHNP